jgi:GNAT superfamily N-acetyltransferase
MEIAPLREAHLEDACRLFVECYREQRQRLPVLPPQHENGRDVLGMLASLLPDEPGVAALERGRLSGYLIGMSLPEFFGPHRGAYCPIWGHAAIGDDRSFTYARLYERLAQEWVGCGCLNHAITLYADRAGLDAPWFRYGFGMQVVDAIRTLEPPPPPMPAGIEVRQATDADLDHVMPLVGELCQYLRRSPIFFPVPGVPTREEYAGWLANPDHVLWLALKEGEPIGYMRSQPPGHDVAYVVTGRGSISITGAFVRPEWRGRGAAVLLLERILGWARDNACQRCAVDFESQNTLGSRFWLRHFWPVCYSLLRRLDERIAQPAR